jgi:hypothetical protein
MQHFAGFHSTLDHRTAIPKPFLGYYPAVISQSELEESVNLVSPTNANVHKTIVGPPKITEVLAERENYDPTNPVPLDGFGETVMAPLGDIALGRSGDKVRFLSREEVKIVGFDLRHIQTNLLPPL